MSYKTVLPTSNLSDNPKLQLAIGIRFLKKDKHFTHVKEKILTTSSAFFPFSHFLLYVTFKLLSGTAFIHCGLTHSHTMTPFDAPGKEAF